jgi:hypothetical protein
MFSENLLRPSEILQLGVADVSEMSVFVYQTVWRHIPEAVILISTVMRDIKSSTMRFCHLPVLSTD